MWYIAMTCESFGWSLDEIMQMNIDKLKKRYPDGFDTERAQKKGGPWHQTFWNRRKVVPKVIPIEVMKKYVEEKG